MFGINGSVIKFTVTEDHCTFSAVYRVPLQQFLLKLLLDNSEADYEIIRFVDVVYVHRRVGLYVHPVGKGMVRPYIIRRADSGKLDRLAVSCKVWVSLRNNQLPCNCDESRKQTT